MQAVLQITKVRKHRVKTFLPFFATSEFRIFSTPNNSGINATNKNIEVYGMGGHAIHAIKAVIKPKV